MRTRRRISVRAEQDLIQWIAANGQNYDMFLGFWERQGWPGKPFTRGYLKKWCWKKYDRIQAARAEHKQRILEQTYMNKERRIRLLTESVERIQAALDKMFESAPHRCPECGEEHLSLGVAEYLRLEEQLRRTLETLAKEYGEYNRPGDESPREVSNDLHAQLLAAARRVKALMAGAPVVVEGAVEEAGASDADVAV